MAFSTHEHESEGEDDAIAPQLARKTTFSTGLPRQPSWSNKITTQPSDNTPQYIYIWHKAGFLLLWVAVGLDLIVSIMGFPIIGQSLSVVCVATYLLFNISFRRVVCSFWFTVIDLFFREISIGGETKLECLKDGRAVIFCVAPHVNQFIDPIVVMKVVAEKTKRNVSWMTAAKSMDRKWIGAFARAMKAIPVVRPEDLTTPGPGFITTKGTHVFGHGGTEFTRYFVKGTVIKTKIGKESCTGKVLSVTDDSHMTLSAPMQLAPAKVVAEKDPQSAYNRAISPAMSCLLFCIHFASFAVGIPYFIPGGVKATELMLAFQLACLFTHVTYATIRDGVPHSAMLGEYYRGRKILRKSDSCPQLAAQDAQGSSLPKTPDHDKPPTKDADVKEKSAYTLLPYVDQSDVFDKVHEALLNGGTIGIFPEGGTHDNTEVLPLKWGVSVMLLGALAKYQGKDMPKISIIPVGLNYFAPHKFRSTVSVDFGDPIQVSEELVDLYRTGNKDDKQVANKAVIDLVLHGLQACTIQAKDVQTLHLFRALRRLFVPRGKRLTVASNVALTQGFAYGFDRIKQDPRVKDVMERVNNYSNMLLQYRVRDYQVQRFKGSTGNSKRLKAALLARTLFRVMTALVMAIFLLPWWLCLSPAGLVGRVISDMQAKKVQKMSVIGTWKVLMATAVIPFLHLLYTACIWFDLGQVAGLGWFFFAPVGGMIAIYATEDSIRVLQSLNGLILLLMHKDIGSELYDMREKLHQEVQQLQEEQQWLKSIDSKTKQSLKRVEKFEEQFEETEQQQNNALHFSTNS
eukprot:CAMPEP_0206235776 /NCGR_PEP_ID=MMETSP0047_2-20121206/13344_1 /ASSEMBLY_ACC=CAM_ASM_000192 /TAXON_ID=195065 /ORGANISM="Chroomonas mesostigmatica_cf, Strain CCMP1168" /LENGTH=797 /DNA_ID=CAMNT_0053660031 /DNA_START=59 /DNA_END=2452 /DNA_ORIENTATION=-